MTRAILAGGNWRKQARLKRKHKTMMVNIQLQFVQTNKHKIEEGNECVSVK